MSYPNDEAEDRVIARALDAEEADEAAMDRATLDEYRRVLAHLPFEEVAPPAALEHRVFEAALASRPASVPSIAGRAAKRRSTARWVTLGAAVAAAAAVVTFMFTTSGDSGGVGGRVELTRTVGAPDNIVNQPGARTATLTSEGVQGATQEIGKVALAPNGEGVLYELQLPQTGPGESRLGLARRQRQARADRRHRRSGDRDGALQGDRPERHGRRHRDVDRDQPRPAGRTRPGHRPRHVLSDCAPAHSQHGRAESAGIRRSSTNTPSSAREPDHQMVGSRA